MYTNKMILIYLMMHSYHIIIGKQSCAKSRVVNSAIQLKLLALSV